jgi:hypothetical protein
MRKLWCDQQPGDHDAHDFQVKDGSGPAHCPGQLARGEYFGQRGVIRYCRACAGKGTRHTCGLRGLQDMLRIG